MRYACLVLLGALATLVLGPAAQADFVCIDNFQSYAVDDCVDGTNGWNVYDARYIPYYTAVVDPSNSFNQALKMHNPGAGDEDNELIAYNNSSGLVMPQGTTPATLFFRFMSTGGDGHDELFGLTAKTDPHSWNDVCTRTATWGEDLLLWTGTYNDIPFQVDCGTWYSFWQVIHNVENTGDCDTWDVYVQGGAYTTRTQLGSDYLFKAGDVVDNSLRTFLLISDWGDCYFDDIYVDTTGENLSDPTSAIPEPTTLALLALGGAISLIRRRRR